MLDNASAALELLDTGEDKKLLEELQAAVHRSRADRGVSGAGAAVQFLGVGVSLRLSQQLHHQAPLSGERPTGQAIWLFAIASHSQTYSKPFSTRLSTCSALDEEAAEHEARFS